MSNLVIFPPPQLGEPPSRLDRGAAEAYEPQEPQMAYKEYSIPEKRYKRLSDEDWDEYDHVQAKKIRDLNR